ncbi:MAG: hypothetical protein NZM44_07475, partial [Candidatus Calescibacterium sp.]|nr:hypothetical protein [Candidatus Calescibacterium sp.]
SGTLSGAEGYRWGYSGKEKDDEVKGNGNSYDFGARLYDSRLGRWWSVDKMFKLYPSHTPYHYSLNNPVYFIDSDGNIIRDANGNPISLRQNAEGGFEIVGEFIGKDSEGNVVNMSRHKQFYEALLKTEKGTEALRRIIDVHKEVHIVFEGKVLKEGHAYTTNNKKDITIHMGIPSDDFKNYDREMFDNIVGTHEILGHIGPDGEEIDKYHDANSKTNNGGSESPAMTVELENSIEYYLRYNIDLSSHPKERYEYYMHPGTDENDQITPEQKENFRREFERIVTKTREKLGK